MRSLLRAQEIVAEYTADPAAAARESFVDGMSSEDRLGCSLKAHARWLRSARVADLRGWASDWAREERDDEREHGT